LALGASFRKKIRCGEIGVDVYGSISRWKFEFPIDSLGILGQLDLENPLRKNMSLGAENLSSSFFLL